MSHVVCFCEYVQKKNIHIACYIFFVFLQLLKKSPSSTSNGDLTDVGLLTSDDGGGKYLVRAIATDVVFPAIFGFYRC